MIDSIRIVVAGAGRMGRMIATSIADQPGLTLSGVWSRGEDIDALAADSNVIIDFSLPDGTETVLDVAQRLRIPLVCGVSGLTKQQMAKIDTTARAVPLVYDRNMSLGIAVLERSVRAAAATLGPEFGVEIRETHHVNKKDAPSGTALKLGQAVSDARGDTSGESVRYEVERRGDVPGDHEVVMRSKTERVTFAHSVKTRQVFADGALRAARWVVSRPPGKYRMQDVLFDDH